MDSFRQEEDDAGLNEEAICDSGHDARRETAISAAQVGLERIGMPVRWRRTVKPAGGRRERDMPEHRFIGRELTEKAQHDMITS